MRSLAWVLPAAFTLVVVPAFAQESPAPAEAAPAAPAAEQSKPGGPWPRPWVVARAEWDPPYGYGVGALVFFDERWSMNADWLLRRRLDVVVTGLGLHFWPRGRFGHTHHQFGIGVGGDVLFTSALSSGGVSFLILPASLDMYYLWRPVRDFGFMVGQKTGFGLTFEARDFGDHARKDSAADALGFTTRPYLGLSFQ